jgi:hypothetical protein
MECPICYTELTPNVNYTITSCKHTFCMKCFISSVLRNNLCPCCRSELYDENENTSETTYTYTEDDDDDDDYSEIESETEEEEEEENNDDDDDDDDNDEENDDIEILANTYRAPYFEPIASVEAITAQFQENGFTMVDLMRLLIPHRDYIDGMNTNTTYAKFDVISEKLNEAIEQADLDAKLEYYETQMMENEDYNSCSCEVINKLITTIVAANEVATEEISCE